jgi:hypothetical protein
VHLVRAAHDGKVYAMKILNKWEMLKKQDVRDAPPFLPPPPTPHPTHPTHPPTHPPTHTHNNNNNSQI